MVDDGFGDHTQPDSSFHSVTPVQRDSVNPCLQLPRQVPMVWSSGTLLPPTRVDQIGRDFEADVARFYLHTGVGNMQLNSDQSV